MYIDPNFQTNIVISLPFLRNRGKHNSSPKYKTKQKRIEYDNAIQLTYILPPNYHTYLLCLCIYLKNNNIMMYTNMQTH